MAGIMDRDEFWRQIDRGASPGDHGLKLADLATGSTGSTGSTGDAVESEDEFFRRALAIRKRFEIGLASSGYDACPWAATTATERAAACGEPVFHYPARKIDAYRERLVSGAAEIAAEIEKTRSRAIATEIDRARRAGLKL